MFDKEEEELSRIGKNYRNAAASENINIYIKRGINTGIQRRKKIRTRRMASLAAVIILVTFISLVRTSTTFAAYITKVPGMGYLVNLINYDMGLKDAVENDYVQNVNSSATHQGIEVTIKDVIIDNSKSIIFYSIKNKSNYKFIDIKEVRVTQQDGKSLSAAISTNNPVKEFTSQNRAVEDKIELNFEQGMILPDKIYISLIIGVGNSENNENSIKKLADTWDFQIPVDKKKIEAMTKDYKINKSIIVEGQKIIFKNLKISPTQAVLEVELDKNNTKKIFKFKDIKLVDEKDNVWGTINNGVTGTDIDENHKLLYFQSNYFKNPNKLYIVGTQLNAVDKDKSIISIDESGKILNAPDDKLKLEKLQKDASGVSLDFCFIKEENTDGVYALFNSIKDADGKEYDKMATSYRTYGDDKKEEFTCRLQQNIKFPISISLDNYPDLITGNFKTVVK